MAGHLSLGDQFSVQVGQIEHLARRNPLDRRAPQQGDAVVDVLHIGRLPFFIVADELPVAKYHVTPVPAVVVSQDGHHPKSIAAGEDRKSTRLNSSHPSTSYAVFCLKKKKPT